MKKVMFSKFTTILQHAVDALAPQLSLQEEFILHWKAVTTFFIDNKGEKVPVEQTSIPAHLEQLLVLLQQEESECEKGMYGPCLEYLLQHKLLETLYSLGRTDYPPGMKQIVLSFFTRLLSRIKQPLLAHVNVYRAVVRLVKTCGEVKAGPTEIEEIQFLLTVCAKIKADPYLVNFFLEVPKSSAQSNQSSVASGNRTVHAAPLDVDIISGEDKLRQEFHLVNTLLNLSHSEDSRVAVKACEGLILCSSLPDLVAAHCLVNTTNFCNDLTQRLIQTYKKLPAEINPLDLENVQAKWGLEVVTQREDEQTFVGKRQLVSFLSWLDYCDQLSTIANPIVAEALARSIHQHFLVPYLQPDLLQMSEAGCITAMAYVSRCLRTVCSQRLLSELVLFLLGEDRKCEKGDNCTDGLRWRLIDRCNSVSEEVCLVALQLFDTLLQKDDEHIVHNLVLRNLESRGYYDGTQRKSSVSQPETCGKDSNNLVLEKGLVLNNNNSANSGPDNGQGQEAESTEGEPQESDSQPENDGISLSSNQPVSDGVSQSEDKLTQVVNLSDSKLQTDTSLNQTEASSTASVCQSDDTSLDDSALIQAEARSTASHSDTNNKPSNDTSLDQAEASSTANVKTSAIGKDDVGKVSEKSEKENEATDAEVCESGSSAFNTPQHKKTEVHKVVNSFLTLLPEDLKSSYQTADSGYDMYLKDAHKQYNAMVESCKTWGFPKDHALVKKDGENGFFEGSFLRMVLDKLSHMLDQSYPVNLQLTSVISMLALVPHPCLHEFLLDPHLPLKPGTRNLYSIFQKISSDIKAQFAAEADLGQRLVRVRRKLMGNTPSAQNVRLNASASYNRVSADSRLEAIIVFEEFCKELSAIAFVKHHAAVTEERSS